MNIRETLTNKKAALYIRVSTTMQVDKDSLPLQKNDLINYAKYALDIPEYEIFEDAGYSAKNTDRPRYQQMMSRLRTGEFSHLIVWKIETAWSRLCQQKRTVRYLYSYRRSYA